MRLEKIKNYFILMRFHKPVGFLLLLWPTLWALWLASDGKPDYLILAIFISGVMVMRAAGCVINDVADRHMDAHVARTRARPLAAGKIGVREALVLFLLLMQCALLLVLQLNRLTICLALIGALLAVVYPFLKRVTHLPQVGLGAAFSWGVPMAFAAVTNSVPWVAWLAFFTALLWPVIYDTMYAMTDRADDLKIGIKSTAILFANQDKNIIALLQVLFLLGLSVVGFYFQLTKVFYVSVIITAVLFVYQQFLIKDRDPQRCFKAFLNNNWVGLIIFVGIAWSVAG